MAQSHTGCSHMEICVNFPGLAMFSGYKETPRNRFHSALFFVPILLKSLRWLLVAVLAVYLALAAAILVLRYWVLPDIGRWKPQIEQMSSRVLGVPLTIEKIEADWRGLHPQLSLSGVRIAGADNATMLDIPQADAVFAWRSVLALSPRLLSLRIERPDIQIRRLADGRLRVAGFTLEADRQDTGHSGLPAGLQWLLAQRAMVIEQASIEWTDEQGKLPALRVSQATFQVYNRGLRHRFALRAQPPQGMGSLLDIRGDFTRRLFAFNEHDPDSWKGTLYARLNETDLAEWQPWLTLPVSQGRGQAQVWLDFDGSLPTRLTLGAALQNLAGEVASDRFAAGLLQFELDGRQGTQQDTVEQSRKDGLTLMQAIEARLSGYDWQARVRASQADLHLPDVFEHPDLHLNHAQSALALQRTGQDWTLTVEEAALQNADAHITLRGNWRSGSGEAGMAALQGRILRASMPAIHRYLPLTVNADARLWLRQGLLQGEIREADFDVSGDLAYFPFQERADAGDFNLKGQFQDAVIDYMPEPQDGARWPALHDLRGTFGLARAALSLQVEAGRMPLAGDDIVLGPVSARIPNMEHHATLLLDGQTEGAAATYLALVRSSPLNHMTGEALSEAVGAGRWKLGLAFEMPLLHSVDTTVKGEIDPQGGSFRYMDDTPEMTALSGRVLFTETGIAMEQVAGQTLGGPVRISGKLGPRDPGLLFEGRASAAGLRDFMPMPALRRLKGGFDWQGRILQRGDDWTLSLSSSLQGLEADMPAPLAKAAQQAWPLEVRWSTPNATAQKAATANPDLRWLTVQAGDDLRLVLERNVRTPGPTYFRRGIISFARPADLPGSGLALAVKAAHVDVDAWEQWLDETTLPPVKGSPRQSLWPVLDAVSVETPSMHLSGLNLQDVQASARMPRQGVWEAQISSRQMTGTANWKESAGAVSGEVVARLQRLSLEPMEDDDKESLSTEFSDLPGIDLQVESFALWGRELGALRLKGRSLQRRAVWQLDELRVWNESGSLDASGVWHLAQDADGEDARGLTVDLKLATSDLGGWLDHMGWPDLVGSGKGVIEGRLQWRDLPWHYDLDKIDGKLSIALEQGRFIGVNSRSARLLALLSVQSITRLGKGETPSLGVLQSGFPWDTIKGQITFANGLGLTDDLRVAGPAATILLAGSANLVEQQWDLQAVVAPVLDVSGAAVATALAVNPVVGIGALLTQWLFKDPLARAMTTEYRVDGSWDDPRIEEAK